MLVLDYGTWSCVFVGASSSAIGLMSLFKSLCIMKSSMFSWTASATKAQARKVGLKSSKMRQADSHCTISNHMDSRFC